jgi:chemotaxis protein CheY-P-specific phosphatase CheC
MGSTLSHATRLEFDIVEDVFERVSSDLSALTDRTIEVADVGVGRRRRRPAAEGGIHISFKLGFHVRGRVLHGCLMAPLPDALTLAHSMMMTPEGEVEERRADTELGLETKDALLEIGSFMASAADSALRKKFPSGLNVHAEGCQGVAAERVPSLVHQPGSELVVGTATCELPPWPGFTLRLVFPVLF